MNAEKVQELFAQITRGTQISAVAGALFPALEELKEQTFREFAYMSPDAMQYAKIAGKALAIELLLQGLRTHVEEAKLASDEMSISAGGH